MIGKSRDEHPPLQSPGIAISTIYLPRATPFVSRSEQWLLDRSIGYSCGTLRSTSYRSRRGDGVWSKALENDTLAVNQQAEALNVINVLSCLDEHYGR